MSLASGNIISVADYNSLKSKIYTECQRRQIKNPISFTNNANLSAGASLSASQFTYLATPLALLDAFSTNGLDTSYYSEATVGSNAEKTVTLNNMSGKLAKTINALNTIVTNAATVNQSNNTDCRNTCAGLCTSCQNSCSTGCSTACTTGNCTGTCTGTCTGSCSGCSGGCSSCTGSCAGGCSSCSGSCSGGCSGSCWTYGCGGWGS